MYSLILPSSPAKASLERSGLKVHYGHRCARERREASWEGGEPELGAVKRKV